MKIELEQLQVSPGKTTVDWTTMKDWTRTRRSSHGYHRLCRGWVLAVCRRERQGSREGIPVIIPFWQRPLSHAYQEVELVAWMLLAKDQPRGVGNIERRQIVHFESCHLLSSTSDCVDNSPLCRAQTNHWAMRAQHLLWRPRLNYSVANYCQFVHSTFYRWPVVTFPY